VAGRTGAITLAVADVSGAAALASPTFTGDPKAPTPATADNDTSIATTAFVKNQSYVTSSTLSDALAVYALQNGFSVFSVTGNAIKSLDGSDNFAALDQGVLNFGNGSTPAGIVINGSSITFADATVQTTAAVAGVPEAPIDGTTYGRLNGTWTAVGGSGMGTLTYSSPYIYDTVTASNIDTIDLGSGSLTANQVFAGNVTSDSTGITFAASSGAVITFADATTQSTAPHDIPSGGTTGQVLAKNSSTDYDVSWVAAGGGGGGGSGRVDVQTFGSSTTSGTFTWTKPTHAKFVDVYLWGGGGGGGSGARQATTSIRSGGGGGGAGPAYYGRLNADSLASTVTVTVGAGGSGGNARTTDNSLGANGSNGGVTSFGPFRANGGNLGLGGSNSGTAGGGSTPTNWYNFSGYSSVGAGGTGGTANGNSSVNIGFTYVLPAGGGGGGGATALVTTNRPGGAGGGYTTSSSNGGSGLNVAIAGGAGGTTAGVAATAGTSQSTNIFICGTGGGGGYYITSAAGGNGAVAGWPSAGGGGGGASDNGFASGAGAAGANGFAILITYT
jgi:hypothetical protein